MIVSLSADTVELLDAQNVNALSVRTELDGIVLAAAVEDLELGVLDEDGRHVWIAKSALIEQGQVAELGADWEEGLERMVDYAESKGWVDDEGRVRAHIESD